MAAPPMHPLLVSDLVGRTDINDPDDARLMRRAWQLADRARRGHSDILETLAADRDERQMYRRVVHYLARVASRCARPAGV